jgi:hypothetical protein
MTLTVQDLVSKFDDFADDAKIGIKIDFPHEETYIVRNIASIERDDEGDVVLIAEIPSNPYYDQKESEGEESEDEKSEGEE